MGCVVGAVAYAARVAHLYNVYNVISVTQIKNPSLLQQQLRNELQRNRLRWAAAHFMIYPFELMLVTLANMCVLHRLHHFSLSSSLSPPWVRAERIYCALMLAGMLIGIGGNFAAGAGYSQSADSYNEALTALAANDLAAAKRYSQQGIEITTQANATASVQRFSEACILLALIAAFVLVGLRSFRVIVTALRRLRDTKISAVNAESHSRQRKIIDDASDKARKLLRKVAITFLLGSGAVRAVFQIMYAIAMSGQDQSNTCSTSSCNPCKNVKQPPAIKSNNHKLHFAGVLQHSKLDTVHSHVSNDRHVNCIAFNVGCCLVGHVWSVLLCYIYFTCIRNIRGEILLVY
jgi:hypothetical protein